MYPAVAIENQLLFDVNVKSVLKRMSAGGLTYEESLVT